MFGTDSSDNQVASTSAPTTQDNTQSQTPVFGVDPIAQTSTSTPSLSSDDSSALPTLTTDATVPTPTVSSPISDDASMPDLSIPEAPEISSAGDIEHGAPSDLMDLKKEALAKLGPLVDKLDQSPEEKFKTTMMMIQASDDKTLIPKAYDAADAIEDEKSKAQALLDIINEINYFTNQSSEKE